VSDESTAFDWVPSVAMFFSIAILVACLVLYLILTVVLVQEP